jgi:molybdopterin molybdotransferase
MIPSGFAMTERAAKSMTFEAARAAVVECVKVLPSEDASFEEALGRVVRQDVFCDTDYPPCDISTMDGYGLAFRSVAPASGERPVWLRVVGSARAGGPAGGSPGEGECVAVTTGACLPGGADTVVPLEDAEVCGDSIGVRKPSPMGAFVRRRGEIARRGDRLRLAGRRATPQVLGLAAAFGAEKIAVTKKPRVGVFATGDELAAISALPDRAHVRASNLAMLVALVRQSGCEVHDAGLSRDSRENLVGHFEACAGCDVTVTSGGVSGGGFDLVPDALRAFGAEVVFSAVQMRPGKRTIFGVKEETLLFGLPGTPGAAFVAFHMIVRPALLAAQGCPEPTSTVCEGRTATALEKDEGGPHTLFLPARIVGRGPDAVPEVEPVGTRGCGDVVALAGAACMIRLNESIRSVAAGEKVEVIILPGAAQA